MKRDLSTEHTTSEELRRQIESEPLPDNMCALMDDCADRYPGRRAWYFFERDEHYTFSDVRGHVNRAAGSLRELGVRKGTHIAIMSPNCGAFLIAWLAIARLGAVMVPVNTRYTPREVKFVIDDGDVEFMIIWHELLPVFEAIDGREQSLPDDRVIVIGDLPVSDRHSWDGLLAKSSSDFRPMELVGLDDLVCIQYTSGTSGLPKGCMLTHRYWLTIGRVMSGVLGFPLKRALYNQNFFYMDGPAIAMMCFYRGAEYYLATRPSASKFINWVRKYRIEYCFYFEALYKHPETPDDANNDLKLLQIFGFNRNHHAELERRYQAIARESFGMTECGCIFYMPVEDSQMVGSGSCGIPAPFREVMVADESGVPVRRGEVGELLVRGPGVLLGYYKRPEANSEAFHDGWFRTGDLIREDDRRYVYVVGRKKDMIRRNAENIAAREVEEVLRGLTEIKEVAAVPVPDDRVGEEVKVYIKLQDGLTKDHVPPQKILQFCESRLAAFKIPRYFAYCEEFPKTDSDRVEKKKLIAGTSDLRSGSYDRVEGVWR